MDNVKFSDLKGKTIAKITVNGDKDVINIKTTDGEHYRLYHDQDCCESVYIQDITGELKDLVGNPLLQAEEATSDKRPDDLAKPEYEYDSQTWTFYKLATIKGNVTIRWYGSSNGYYSESVSFDKVDDNE